MADDEVVPYRKLAVIRTEEDLHRELAALLRLAPELGPVVERAGPVPLRATPPGLRGLVGTMIGQQVSRASAEAILFRLSAIVDLDDPEAIRALGEPEMRAAGLSRAKARTLVAIAEAAASGALDLPGLADVPPCEAIGKLVRLPGIGPWTAECFLLFSVGHADIFPAGDLALQVAVGRAFEAAARPKAREVAALAAVWAPHRSIAARLLWAYYAQLVRREAAPAGHAPQDAAQRPNAAGPAGFTKATR